MNAGSLTPFQKKRESRPGRPSRPLLNEINRLNVDASRPEPSKVVQLARRADHHVARQWPAICTICACCGIDGGRRDVSQEGFTGPSGPARGRDECAARGFSSERDFWFGLTGLPAGGFVNRTGHPWAGAGEGVLSGAGLHRIGVRRDESPAPSVNKCTPASSGEICSTISSWPQVPRSRSNVATARTDFQTAFCRSIWRTVSPARA